MRSVAVGAVATVALLVLGAGCTEDNADRYGNPPESTVPPSVTGSTRSIAPSSSIEERQVIEQYVRFWTDVLPKAFAAPAASRRGVLGSVTVEPELGVLLGNMKNNDKKGEKGYGVDVPIHQKVELRADIALVRGCLNSSDAGIMRIDTGKKLTRGPARNRVLANLKRGVDGIWRVSAVTYPGGPEC